MTPTPPPEWGSIHTRTPATDVERVTAAVLGADRFNLLPASLTQEDLT